MAGEVAPVPSEEEGPGPQVAILFVGVALVLGMVCRHVFHGTRVPYTVALLLLGIGIGGLGQLTKSIVRHFQLKRLQLPLYHLFVVPSRNEIHYVLAHTC